MGLGDWLGSVGRGVAKGIDDAGNAVGHAVGTAVGDGYTFVTGDAAGGQRITNSIDAVSDAVFFDGTVSGTNPAQIYKWFHDGPGTGDYGTAENNCSTLHTNLAQYADHFAKANSALRGGWTGPAGTTALQNVSPSQTIAEALAQRAEAKQGAYSGQISVFDGTKSKLVNVPDSPPPPNNPLTMDPISTASDAAGAAVYQAGTKSNQHAYTAYQPPTQSHLATIPQGDTAIDTGQSNDSGSTPQQGAGITQPGGYHPTLGRSGTGQQPSTAGHSGTPLSTGSSSQGPGGASGTPVGLGGTGTLPSGSPDGASTTLAGYQGPPVGSGSFPTPGGYDGGVGSRGGSGGADGGAGGVFAGGGFGGSGSGYGGAAGGVSGGRMGALGSGSSSSAGAGAGAASEGMAGRSGAAAGARGAAGQAGAGGTGAGAGGRGGKREEDREHKTAAYLINEDNGNEVVGDLPPSLPAGGVIGG